MCVIIILEFESRNLPFRLATAIGASLVLRIKNCNKGSKQKLSTVTSETLPGNCPTFDFHSGYLCFMYVLGYVYMQVRHSAPYILMERRKQTS